MNTAPYKAVSLFSGAGGMDVGFSNAGVSIEVANEIDHEASKTYRLNHQGKLLEGNIRDYVDHLKLYRGIDLVFGGPPCQGFSVAGKMNPNDERSALIHTYFDVVDEIKPRAFICENVKALATLSKWAAVRSELINRASKSYSTALIILNSSEFGVPQNRERMFLVGFNKDEINVSESVLSNWLSNELAKLQEKPPTIRDIVCKLGRAGSLSNKRICKARITFAKSPVLRNSPYAGMLFNGAGRPLSPDGRSSTLPASMGGNKTPIVDESAIFDGSESFIERYHLHLTRGGKPRSGDAPSHLRRLTIDECVAIQTFPPNYVFAGSQSSVFRQIGNAVPCKLAEAVARAAINILEADEHQIPITDLIAAE
jgi:DNA (cytosine-5)-methyltransferase 1